MFSCRFEVLYCTGPMVKSKLCNKAASKHGFCEEHAYVLEVFELASSIGCPSIELDGLIIGRGTVAWEAYAVCMPKKRVPEIKRRLVELRAVYDRENRQAIERAVRQVRERVS